MLLRRALVQAALAIAPSAILGCKPHCPRSAQAPKSLSSPSLPPPDRTLLSSTKGPLPVLQQGQLSLRQASRELVASDDTLLGLLEDRMRSTLLASDRGVGLAAPQVGINARAALITFQARTDHPHTEFLVNPTIIERSEDSTLDYEGCLSVPNVCGLVRRNRWVVVQAVHKQKLTRIKAFGFDARILQHEIDHLDGILYTDRVEGPLEPKEKLKELREKLQQKLPPEQSAPS